MKVRTANPKDVSLILSFIQKKADFDRHIGAFSGILQVSEDKISRTLFSTNPFAYVLFVEDAGREIGFALYGFRYSSFIGQPSIWLDDLFIDENMRSQGAGAALMQSLAQIALKHDCTHISWTADARNTRGLNFYHGLGAKIIKQEDNRCYWQWDFNLLSKHKKALLI